MKDITQVTTKTIWIFKLLICTLLIFLSPRLCFSQDYIPELPKDKNLLFALLKVKIEIIQQELLRGDDSSVVSKNKYKNYYDTKGFLIKKETFDSSFTIPSLVHEYIYNDKGLYTEFLLNGKLKERREYNETGKITHTYWYDDEIFKTDFHNYDSFGNEIEILIKYSSGRIDTFLITRYNYDYSVNPPLIKSDTTFYKGQYYPQILISESDSIGRCTRLIALHSNSTYNHTTLFYYNDRNLLDSTIHFSNSGVSKYLREYDSYQRLIKTIDYMNNDSIPSIWHCGYDDKIYMTIDSLFQKNDLDQIKNSNFEKRGVKFESLYKGENEISVKITTEYYPNGLIKNTMRFNYRENKIEKKFYDYEFY